MRRETVFTMADRDSILVDFQAFTGIDNLEQCMTILENHNWDLVSAVENAMVGLGQPAEGDAPSASPVIAPDAVPVLPTFLSDPSDGPVPVYDLTGDAGGPSPAAGDVAKVSHVPPPPLAEASSSYGLPRPTRLLQFNIEYKSRSVKLILSDTDTVGRIKELLEIDLSVPRAHQQLGGWVNKNDRRILDSDILRDLRLPKENTLFLLTPDLHSDSCTAQSEESPVMERLSQTFTLNIRHTDKDKVYRLDFPGSRTIGEIKGDLYSLTDIPMRHQVWSGWPPEAEDETMTLAGCGICYPSHNLELTSSQPRPSAHNSAAHHSQVDHIDISDDEFEDAHEHMDMEEDIFGADDAMCRRHQPLMPDQVSDQTIATEHFSREFSNRYGDCHPVFYIGSLEDAIKDALQTKAVDRKLLAIYLHHDNSILANVFCSQILCAESIVSYLSSNFITWGWDLTSEANRAWLLTMVTQHFGSVAANTVRNYKPDELPLMLLISRNRSINEVVNVIQANVTLDELMTQLIHAEDVFQGQQHVEIKEEEERDAREMMKREQDLAYEVSLAADRAKAQARAAEEEKMKEQQLVEQQRRDEEDRIRREEEQEKEAIRQSLANELPDEPPADCKETMARIRFRLPGGDMITRRFLGSNRLQVLLNFVISKGFDTSEYKVLTTFPRRDLTQLDNKETLEALKLCPQETIILEEKASQD